MLYLGRFWRKGWINHPGAIHPIIQNCPRQIWKCGKKFNEFFPPNRSNGLCLFFCLYPSSMRNTIPWGQVWNLLYSKEFIYRNKYVKVRDDASLFFRFITPASVLDIGDDVDLIHIQMEDSSPDPGGKKTIKFNIYLKKCFLTTGYNKNVSKSVDF